MLGSNSRSNNQIAEATVFTVDIRRGVCTVRTETRQLIANVRWNTSANGEYAPPEPRQRVLLGYDLGYPRIISKMAPMTSQAAIDTYMSGRDTASRATTFAERYNLSTNGGNVQLGEDLPKDLLPGDKATTTRSGAGVYVSVAGSVYLKATSLAQVFISRLDDLVRVVSRNYEKYSDASVEIDAHRNGQLYTYLARFKDRERSRNMQPEYYEVYGNVPAGEALGDNPQQTTESSPPPAADTILKKQVVTDSTFVVRWFHTLTDVGHSVRKWINGGKTVEETADDVTWKVTAIDGGTTSYQSLTANVMTISMNGQVLMTFNANGVVSLNANDSIHLQAANNVTVQCADLTANVDNTASITCTDLTANVSSATVTADTTTITSPSNTVNGPMVVTGILTANVGVATPAICPVGGTPSGNAAVFAGPITSSGGNITATTGDVVAGTISLQNHTHHFYDAGDPVSPDTTLPPTS